MFIHVLRLFCYSSSSVLGLILAGVGISSMPLWVSECCVGLFPVRNWRLVQDVIFASGQLTTEVDSSSSVTHGKAS